MSELAILRPPVAPEFVGMTFPAFRHLLDLQPALRLLSDANRPPIQPLAVGATVGGVPAGLAVVEAPITGEEPPELLSLFVSAEHRRQGIGTALVKRVEAELAERGCASVRTVFTAGKPGIAAFERVLVKCAWEEPTPRSLSARFTVEEAQRFPWLGRYPLREGCEIFPWVELKPEERVELRRSQAATGWIKPDLVPWNFDEHGFEPVTSVGMRCPDGVVGWVINHVTAQDTLRFTCSFIRKDLGRRGRILPLFSESINRLAMTAYTTCTFIAPVRHATMVAFVERYMAPWVSFLEETRGASKALVPGAASEEVPRSEQTIATGGRPDADVAPVSPAGSNELSTHDP